MKTRQAIGEFINSRISGNLSPMTIAWYRTRLERFAEFCPELPQEPRPLEAFLASIKGTPETRHAYFRAIRALFRFISDRYDTSNPMTKVAAPRCPRKVMATLEPEQLMRLLLAVSNLRDRAVLTLVVDTGMRASEIAALRKKDVKEHTIVAYGKCGEREIPISNETRRLLFLLMVQDGKDEFVFHGHKGPITRKAVYSIVSRHMRRAGIPAPKLGPHRIRHAFGKGYLVNGGDLRSLQQIMGHASITTTEKYASLNLSDTIEKHHRFSLLRGVHAAAQESFFDTGLAIKEACTISEGKGQLLPEVDRSVDQHGYKEGEAAYIEQKELPLWRLVNE